MSIYVRTPLKPLTRINERTGKNFQVKMECCQPDGSFKIRGISRFCEVKKAEGVTRLVVASGGNAGHAAAICAKQMGMECSVVIPGTASRYMAEVIRRDGGQVEVAGEIFDDALARAHEIVANDPSACFVHAFDDPLLWEGHSTMIDELVEQTEKPDAIVCSVGGGGLLNGVIQGLDRNGWGDIPVIGVEVEGAPTMRKAIEAGHPVVLDKVDTLANTLCGLVLSEQTMEYIRTHKIISHLITDEAAARGAFGFVEDFRMLVELACGASMSVAYDLPEVIKPYQNVVIIACGGAGVNLEKLLEYKKIFNL